MKSNKIKRNSGITLIALIITIIVMLILVSVTISMAINGGLFQKASEAGTATNGAIANEQLLAKGEININNVVYDSVEDYIAGRPSTGVKIKLGRTGTKVTEVPLPSEDFEHVEGTEIDTGYVIKHKTDENEFVWVPVEKNQKITLEVESKTEIKELKLYDPYGDEIDLGITEGNIGTTYSNKEIEPTVNGMYMAVAKTEGETPEEPIITQRTLTVKSLYALDTMNDWFCSDEYAKTQGEFDTIDEFATAYIKAEYGLDSIEAALQAMNYPTLEVGLSAISVAYMKAYQDTENHKADVEKNGGFYIARYEAGTDPENPRESGSFSAEVSAIITANGVPVTKEGYAPYCLVTHSQALGLVKSMYEENNAYEVSLITGSGWDRTLGWFQETGRKNAKEIAVGGGNSTNWGNYYNAEFNLEKGQYYNWTEGKYKDVSEINNKKSKDNDVLLTTGATTRNSVNNIYDLAGNVEEWTSESRSSDSRVYRGGYYDVMGFSYPVAGRGYYDAGGCGDYIGFRGALYLK